MGSPSGLGAPLRVRADGAGPGNVIADCLVISGLEKSERFGEAGVTRVGDFREEA